MGGARQGGGGAFGAPTGDFAGPATTTAGGGAFGAIPQAPAATKGGVRTAWDPTVTGAACARLRLAAARLDEGARALAAAPDLRVPAAAGASGPVLAACADELLAREAALRAAARRLEDIAGTTEVAGRLYETASDAVLLAVEQLAGGAAWALGAALGAGSRAVAAVALVEATKVGLLLLPAAALLVRMRPELLGQLLALAPAGAAAAQATVDRAVALAGAAVGRLASALPPGPGGGALATPEAVLAARLLVESAPALAAGLLGVPLPAVRATEQQLGEDELLALLAGGAALAGRGALGVGAVRPELRPRSTAEPPRPVTTAGEAMAVIRAQEDQVVVHELRMPDGSRHFQVFIDGTQDFGLSPETGLDGLANVEHGAGDLAPDSGSAAAVAEALRQAGVGEGDTVDLWGYSQGGHAAAIVAASQEFDVRSVVTIGSPVDGVDVPAGVAAIAIAHEGDFVPAAQGIADDPSALGMLWDVAHGRDPSATRAIETVALAPAERIGEGLWGRHDGDEYLATLPGAEERSVQLWHHHERMEARLEGAVGVATTSVRLRRDGV